VLHVFVDYDGTMTDKDTFDALVMHFAGAEALQRLSEDLEAGAITLRDSLSASASLLRCTIEEADTFVAAETRVDPSFAQFADRCTRENVPLTILSAGLRPLIERALARHGLSSLDLLANGVHPSPHGWTMEFLDDSAYGHDKAAAVHAAHSNGERVVFIGDGISDYAAALEADEIFAKRGRPLEDYLRERGIAFTPFASFAEIERALFGELGTRPQR
jgi:2,3-diketo-5-methylthio-1-phosphopentane phosphatase